MVYLPIPKVLMSLVNVGKYTIMCLERCPKSSKKEGVDSVFRGLVSSFRFFFTKRILGQLIIVDCYIGDIFYPLVN